MGFLHGKIGFITKASTWPGTARRGFEAQEVNVIQQTSQVVLFRNKDINYTYIGLSPLPVAVTTRINYYIFSRGSQPKPSFATVTGRGDNPIHTCMYAVYIYIQILCIWISCTWHRYYIIHQINHFTRYLTKWWKTLTSSASPRFKCPSSNADAANLRCKNQPPN